MATVAAGGSAWAPMTPTLTIAPATATAEGARRATVAGGGRLRTEAGVSCVWQAPARVRCASCSSVRTPRRVCARLSKSPSSAAGGSMRVRRWRLLALPPPTLLSQHVPYSMNHSCVTLQQPHRATPRGGVLRWAPSTRHLLRGGGALVGSPTKRFKCQRRVRLSRQTPPQRPRWCLPQVTPPPSE